MSIPTPPANAPMILAAGLTPAWQQILALDALRLGEVNRAREIHWCASGKGLNVSLALHHLGARVKTLSVVGGRGGAAIQDEFRHLGLDVDWITSAVPTRVCTTVLDAATHTTTELVENSPPSAPEDLERFQTALAKSAKTAAVVVLSGSLPAGTPATFYRDLIAGYSGRVILDARGPELLAALPCRPFLVKPNREELARTLGVELRHETDLLQAMCELNRRGAEWVVITQGQHAVLATNAGRIHRLVPPRVQTVVNPIGCGDCLAAGIAWAVQGGRSPLDAIRWGMAAAADNLGQLLPARLKPERVARWFEGVTVAPG